MFKFFRDLFGTIVKEIVSLYLHPNPHPTNATNRSTAPAELQYETDASRALLKKDTQMKVARILRRM